MNVIPQGNVKLNEVKADKKDTLSQIDDLDKQITTTESTISALELEIDDLEDKNIQFFDYNFTDENGSEIDQITHDFEGVFEGQKVPKNLDFTAFHMKNGVN